MNAWSPLSALPIEIIPTPLGAVAVKRGTRNSHTTTDQSHLCIFRHFSNGSSSAMNSGLRKLRVTAIALTLITLPAFARAGSVEVGKPLPHWSPGELEIIHINTGGGNSAFVIFPDSTTLLVDAGDLDRTGFVVDWSPLKLAPRRPADSVTPGEAIRQMIVHEMPRGRSPRLDYALITHFHVDHYGFVRPGLKASKLGDYVLTGITEVGDVIPIGTLIDRGFPDYTTPIPLEVKLGPTLTNYRKFQAAQAERRGTVLARLDVGSDRQIHPLQSPNTYPSFRVLNVKANGEITDGHGGRRAIFDPKDTIAEDGSYLENALSQALKISYGRFSYFTGGDMTGLGDGTVPGWYDTETPVSAVVGPVDVLTLDHHGNRDATNANFLRAMQPRVIVQQSYVSDQPGGDVVHRLISPALWQGPRDFFSTFVADETKVALGPWLTRALNSSSGHIVVRVVPGGSQYFVYTVDDQSPDMLVTSIHGPYESRSCPTC